MRIQKNQNILKLVRLAMLTALVVVLQLLGSFIKIGPLPLSFVLVPIVIGAFTMGASAGAFLGFVFGLVTVIMGIVGADAFSFVLWGVNPVVFVLLCLFKATAAGFVSGLVYKLLGKAFNGKYATAQTVIASITAPIVNTGIFVVGMLVFFFGTLTELPTLFPGAFDGFQNEFALLFLGLAGLNFVGEFLVNLLLSPAIIRVMYAIKKRNK